MYTIAVIPARGGSKGIPLKNIREVAGKPLVAWAIEACLSASGIDRTIVSTDHEGIAAVAREWGAEVPFMRPEKFAGDAVTLDPVIYHAVTTLEKRADTPPIDVVLTVQPTNPTLRPATLDRAIETLIEGGFDSVLMLRKTQHLYWRKSGDTYEPLFKERLNRQQLEPLYYETGVVFASRRSIITPENRLGTNIGHVVGEDDEALDIDTELDLKLAELVIEQQQNKENC